MTVEFLVPCQMLDLLVDKLQCLWQSEFHKEAKPDQNIDPACIRPVVVVGVGGEGEGMNEYPLIASKGALIHNLW